MRPVLSAPALASLLSGAALLVALCAGGPARASGGSHVVDDSEAEAPGHCHLELWGTYIDPRAGLVNIGPGCTHHAVPNLEVGGYVQPSLSTGASAAGAPGPGAGGASFDALFGPALKYTLRHDSTGLGVGVDAGFTFNGSRRRMEAVSALVPVTFRVSDRVRVNLNAGGQYVRADKAVESFLGAQVEVALGSDLTLMVEHFGRSHAFSGDQAGLRWTPKGRNFDLDLVAGRRIDGVSATAVSFGVTLRR